MTVVPGDYLVVALHGVLVIPAHLLNEVIEYAEYHSEREKFQQMLLLKGESMIGVYPPSQGTLRRFDEWRKSKRNP